MKLVTWSFQFHFDDVPIVLRSLMSNCCETSLHYFNTEFKVAPKTKKEEEEKREYEMWVSTNCFDHIKHIGLYNHFSAYLLLVNLVWVNWLEEDEEGSRKETHINDDTDQNRILSSFIGNFHRCIYIY